MKQSDIFSIILVASIGTLAAFFVCDALLGDPDERATSFKVIAPISKELTQPNSEVFNPDAINPTVEVYVGECRDVDRNGILDRAELVSCGKATPEQKTEAEKTEKEKQEKTTEEKKKKLQEGRQGDSNDVEAINNQGQTVRPGNNQTGGADNNEGRIEPSRPPEGR